MLKENSLSRRLLQSMPFTKFGGFNVAADRFWFDPSVVKSSSYSPITDGNRVDTLALNFIRVEMEKVLERKVNSLLRMAATSRQLQTKCVKSNGNRPFFVHTLARVSRLEAEGIPANQAKTITVAMRDALNGSFDKLSKSLVSQREFRKVGVTQKCSYGKMKSELKIDQGYHFSSLQHENKKRRGEIEQIPTELQVVSENARGDIEKSGSELWNEIDIDRKIAGILSSLNVGKGHMQDRLANQTAEISKLEDKIDQAIRSCRVELEAAETEVKNIMVTVFSISAVGFAVLCFFV